MKKVFNINNPEPIRVHVKYTVEETIEYSPEDFDYLADDDGNIPVEDILDDIESDIENPQDTGLFMDREAEVLSVVLKED